VPDRLVGREPELAQLSEFLGGAASRTLVLQGAPGIGKTALWEAGIDAARALGLRVAVARPSGAEARHSFAGLIDLFDGIDMAGLPGPQRSALEAALLRAAPGEAPPQAIALGVLNKLRWLSPLVVAVDDLQWLDAASSAALAFAAPRLADEPVAFLLARRPGRRPPLERVLQGRPLERIEVGPLGFDETRRLLAERLGLAVPRPLMRRIAETTLGNPLFALEIGRALAERGAVGGEMPLPDAVEDMLGVRVAALPAPQRRALLAVALSGELHADELAAVADAEDAVDAGLLRSEDGRVRAAHPLLAAAAAKHARARDRRELHLALARAVAGEERRARHLALAAQRPDAELADAVAAAADGAAARGAAAEAVDLAERALRLTPADLPERVERLLALAHQLETAGERRRVTGLLAPELEALPSGGARVRAWLLLANGSAVATYHDRRAHFEHALAEAGADPALRAHALASMALSTAAEGVERIGEVEAWAQEALAVGAGPRVERLALRALGWARSLSGRPIDDVCERFTAASPGAVQLVDSPEPVAALRLVWRGDLERARATLTRFLELADERGESVSYAWMRLNLCELGLRAADWGTVSRLLDEWAESGDEELLITPTYQRCRALVAAGRGLGDEARRWAAPALEAAEPLGFRWQVLESRRALGIAALLAHEPKAAAEHLHAVWDHTLREGIDEPGAFPVAPELVGALAELGRLAEAQAVTDRLRDLAEEQEHPWGLAAAKRCAAILRLPDEAPALSQAADDYERLGLRGDAAHTLLALGRGLRRHRKWGGARDALERAAAAFDALDSPGWAEEARSELARVGARRPTPSGELTPAERRVVELAADGSSNKEIAQALFVSVRTVEAHLTHAYAKLGVRSRAQLTSRLGAIQ
jgi:DNA-binding CsgD family transcriptional regulator